MRHSLDEELDDEEYALMKYPGQQGRKGVARSVTLTPSRDNIECGDNESRMSHKIFHMKPTVGFFAVCRLLWSAPNNNQLTYLGWIVQAWMGSCMNRHLSKSLVAWRYLFWSSCPQFKVHLDLYMLCVILDFDELKYVTKTQFEGTYNQILKTCKLELHL